MSLKSFFLLFCFLIFPLFAQVTAKLNIAVNDLKGNGLDQPTSRIISERVRSELVKSGGFRVMERNEMTTVLKEQGFQKTGACDEASCLVEVGQLLGVDRMIAGTVGKISNFFTISLRMIHVGTGEILFTVDEDYNGEIEGLFGIALPNIAKKARGKAYGITTQETTSSTQISATNSHNTNQPKHVMSEGTRCIDADGNVYTTVIIGKKEWTIENLRTTKYNDGTTIPHVTDRSAWGDLSTPGYCYYNNSTDPSFQKKWGALYNWHAVNSGKLAPTGWHVPYDADWTALVNYLIANGHNYDGSTSGNKIAKSIAAQSDWSSNSFAGVIGNDLSKNNASNFSALPAGSRSNKGIFSNQSNDGYWWSATEFGASSAYHSTLSCNASYLGRYVNRQKYGFSVRLVRDLD